VMDRRLRRGELIVAAVFTVIVVVGLYFGWIHPAVAY
jgi:hypothetical protein